MNMKRIFNIYKKSALVVAILFGTLMTSCTDYLTIIPPDKIVHEKFWQTKDEVNGMLATSYIKLISTDAISKAIVWGESRADNLVFPADYDKEIKYIIEANILDENSYAKWGIYYEAINYANLVIEYAPMVVDRDPDFTEGDLQIVLGEMYAMRAMCHFYLVRAFRDIPMALVPAVNDAELPNYEQVHPIEALTHILNDLNKAENMVMKSGRFADRDSNYGRITQNAVLSIKADVCLWLAAFATYYEGETELVVAGDVQKYYDECIASCQAVIDNMEASFNESHNGKPVANDYPYHLIMNEGEVDDIKETKISTAYNQIFGAMNSSESIFELQITGDNATSGYCKGVPVMYGAEAKGAKLIVAKNFMGKFENDDLRKYSYTTYPLTGGESAKDDFYVAKYTAGSSPANDFRKADNFEANWIVYRKTDVLLMMAEAMSAKPNANGEDFKEAYNIARVINMRSRQDTTRVSVPLVEPTERGAALSLVLDERARELSFEGKRWFDLVRKALRDKSTKDILFVADKLTANQDVLKSKMATIDGLFFPIHIDELRYNKNLKQNPAYADDDESMEMN